jgi:hypothetical protein
MVLAACSESHREKDREGASWATENERAKEMKRRSGVQDDRARWGGAHATSESSHVALRAYGRSAMMLQFEINYEANKTTSKIHWNNQLSHPLSPDSTGLWSQRKRQSCISWWGEQHWFKGPELTRHRLGDMELQRRAPKIEIMGFNSSRLKLHFRPRPSPNTIRVSENSSNEKCRATGVKQHCLKAHGKFLNGSRDINPRSGVPRNWKFSFSALGT